MKLNRIHVGHVTGRVSKFFMARLKVPWGLAIFVLVTAQVKKKQNGMTKASTNVGLLTSHIIFNKP